MKKVLFATTALVATAGMASADVALSGWAEMGIYGGGVNSINGSGGETQFFQDLDVNFSMSGETDNGLTFGASVDLDENGAFTPNDDGGATIFISGNFGTLTMGDTDGALDWAVTETTGNPGSIDDSETLHAGYLGAFGDGAYDGQILRYDYSFGDFGFAASLEMDDVGTAGVDDGWALGVKYSTMLGGADVAFGLGYQTLDPSNLSRGAAGFSPGNLGSYFTTTSAFNGTSLDIIGVSVSADFGNGFSAGVEYSDWNSNIAGEDATHYQISFGYETGPISVGANYGKFDQGATDVSGYGIAVGYDLGGGASIVGAYADSDITGVTGLESWSLGVSMSF